MLDLLPGSYVLIAVTNTDVVLSGTMKAREVADAARALRRELKTLFTSGYTRHAVVHKGRLDEGVQLLSKPYNRAQLTAKLRSVLGPQRVGRDVP